MQFLTSLLFRLVMLVVAVASIVVGLALFDENRFVAACFGVIAIASLVCVFKRERTKRRQSKAIFPDEPELQNWHAAESRPVKRPRDPRTKFLLANIGKEVVVSYKGHEARFVPLRVYTKPQYRKTY